MLDQLTRNKMNCRLKEAIVGARMAKGLGLAEAASILDLTESELRAIEENPVLISLSVLNQMMVTYGTVPEFVRAIDAITIISMQTSNTDKNSVHQLLNRPPFWPIE